MEAGKIKEARLLLEEICSDRPQDGWSWMQLVSIYAGGADYKNAEHACLQLIALSPSAPEPYIHLSSALLFQNKKVEATDALREALNLRPNNPGLHFKLGKALHSQAKLEEALQCYEKAVSLNPGIAEVYDSMGSLFKSRGQIARAIELYRICVAARPDSYRGHSDLVFAYNYSSDYGPEFVYREHLRWGESHGGVGGVSENYSNVRDPDRRLRIGYVSPDFYRHSVSYFFEPVLECCNHEKFETFCYANVLKPDSVTTRLRELADNWHDTSNLSDQQVADLVRSHSIDVLVDLTGHTGNSRLPVFAKKPAPVQVAYLGYPNTTGLRQMDYRITDKQADPEGVTDQWYTEKLVRLSGGFLSYRPPSDSPTVSIPPFESNGYITFGSFNNLAKITPDVIAVWSGILMAEPESRLIVKNLSLRDAVTMENIVSTFNKLGVDKGRVDLRPPVFTTSEHLEAYSEVDIALDTFPYNGTTTTCEALWMGVPVITLAGVTHVGRVGVSLLHRVRLDALIAKNHDAYIEIALKLARDPSRIISIRKNLRNMMRDSSLCDGARLAHELESAYRNMWKTWCAIPAGM